MSESVPYKLSTTNDKFTSLSGLILIGECPRSKRPSSNREYWERKLDANMIRDARNKASLQKLGWTVITIWECGLEEGTANLLSSLSEHRDRLI